MSSFSLSFFHAVSVQIYRKRYVYIYVLTRGNIKYFYGLAVIFNKEGTHRLSVDIKRNIFTVHFERGLSRALYSCACR